MTVNIAKLASVIRSKNVNLLYVALDIMFQNHETYRKVKNSGAINEELIQKLYRIPHEWIKVFRWFDQGNALKITIRRRFPSGNLEDTDLFGAQQHAPLYAIEIPWEEVT